MAILSQIRELMNTACTLAKVSPAVLENAKIHDRLKSQMFKILPARAIHLSKEVGLV